MNSKFKITIPKPCHENWNKMSPKEKGRFCSSCAKTVVDFTKKTIEDIQNYLVENKNEQVCGHFYKKQLDAIVIEIPQITFQQQLSFQKLFILTLFFLMGTTLFSCQYNDGKKQKIENVILQDSIKIIEEEVGLIFSVEKVNDSLTVKEETFILMGKIEPPSKTKNDSIVRKTNVKNNEPIDITTIGEIIEVVDGMIDLEYIEEEISCIIIDTHPRFKEAKNLSKKEAKKDFDKKINEFIQKNYDSKLN
ncbi:MAG: hypothetical protein V3V28_01830 [Polaribacter sp.]|uniref:hypothetical protein n=1 Tax=Polaribacter sp. TaxID=1920175 RepID=UPI002F35ACF8